MQWACPPLPNHCYRGTLRDAERSRNDPTALREKPLKIYEVMKRANLPNEEACQSLLMKMRERRPVVKFDIHKGRWMIG